ncbi:IS1 family transposase [Candidatus Pacearchaeota archaeon]|nr:IS1 family transposase [Candidatus Pacearchaeota archaeon]
MIVKVEIEAGPELKALLEKVGHGGGCPLRGGGKKSETVEIAKSVFEKTENIQKKVDEKKKPEEKPNCIHCNSSNVWKHGTETLKGGKTFQKWRCQDCEKTFGFKHHRRIPNKVRQKAEELLRAGKKVMVVKGIVEKEFDIELKKATVYYWSRNLRPAPASTPKEPEPDISKEEGEDLRESLEQAKEEPSEPYEPESVEEPDPLDVGKGGGDETEEEEPEPVEEPEPTPTSKINTAELKSVKITIDHLMIINDEVMCPKSKMAVDVDSCQVSCGSHVATVKCNVTGEPYVMCLKAGGG